jgi:hypothetical protein
MTEEARTDEMQHPEPVVLCRLAYEEAVLLSGLLNAEGVEARVESDGAMVYPAPTTQGVAVLVPADQLEEARRIRRERVGE